MSSESPSPTRERLPSTDMGSKPTARRTSSRLLSVTGGTDSALGAAGDRAAAAQQGRNKQVSLSQQLENIKVQGTDSFIKAITPQREPIFPYGKRNWKQSTKYPQMDSASTLPLGSPLPGAKGWDGVRKASIMVSASRKLSMLGALTSGNQQGGNGAEAGLGSAAQTQVQPSPRPQVPAPPSAPRPSSASTAGGGGNPRTQQGRSSGVAGRPGVTLSIPAPDRTHSTPPRQSGRAPSSPSSPRQAEPVTPRPPEATASPRSRGHSKGKPEVSLGCLFSVLVHFDSDSAVRIPLPCINTGPDRPVAPHPVGAAEEDRRGAGLPRIAYSPRRAGRPSGGAAEQGLRRPGRAR